MRSNFGHGHPISPHSRNPRPPPQFPHQIQKVISKRILFSPSSHPIEHQPRPIPGRLSFHNQRITPTSMQFYNPHAPPFRQLRQRYIKIIPGSMVDEQPPGKMEKVALKNPFDIILQNQETRRPQEIKQDKLLMSFGAPQIVYVDKKLNITEVAPVRNENMKPTNHKIECIFEEKPHLEESLTFTSQIGAIKKKLTESENQNNRLKAELFNLHTKISFDEQKRRQRQENLGQEIKELKIDLKKTQNETLMSKISEAQMSNKFKKIFLKNQEKEKEIAKLKQIIAEKQEQPESTNKSQTAFNYKSQTAFNFVG